MKGTYLSFAIMLAVAVSCFGQKATSKKSPDDSPQASAKAGQKSSAGGQSSASVAGQAISLSSVTEIQAQLQKQLDVRKAQVGDQVVLKTVKAVKQDGETVIPKGTNLIGRITSVQQKSSGNANSSLGIVFDRIEGNGIASPITATVLSITDVRSAASLGDSMMADVSGSSRTSGSASAGGSGGLLGGVGGTVAPVLNTATSTVGSVAGTAANTVGSVAGTATNTIGSTASGLGQTIGGIQIMNSTSGSANGTTTLSAAGKNLKLEKGVTFNLQLSSQASGQAGN